KILFFDVLAMVALGTGQAEQTFLENGVAAIPKGQGEAKPALAVGHAKQAVLAPAVSPAAGLVVCQVIPVVAVRRVIFPHTAPVALREVRTPALPVLLPASVLLQPDCFGIGIAHASLISWVSWLEELQRF